MQQISAVGMLKAGDDHLAHGSGRRRLDKVDRHPLAGSLREHLLRRCPSDARQRTDGVSLGMLCANRTLTCSDWSTSWMDDRRRKVLAILRSRI